MAAPLSTDYYYEVDKSSLGKGTYQITLIATDISSGVPSGGTIQM